MGYRDLGICRRDKRQKHHATKDFSQHFLFPPNPSSGFIQWLRHQS
jgi:hypothetical protein